jgi:5-methylcytosine-specific restriction endonuclease McrBC regulatory subunit McrC
LISLIKYNEQTRSELKRYQSILKNVISPIKVNPEEIYSLRFNRINQYYEKIIKLSLLIIEERFIRSVHKGKSTGFNFIVNMNRVYEDFITEMFVEVIKEPLFKLFTVEKQQIFSSLVKERKLITKPDIILKKNKTDYPIIIDAKYKKQDLNSDYYQVVAYSLAIKTSKVCCLIYPQTESSEIENKTLTLTRDLLHPTDEVKIYTKTIDLSASGIEEPSYPEYICLIKDQVRKILGELISSV